MTEEERIFNFRLSRAGRIVENAFGILANRFRCMLTTMRQKPETVSTIVQAACCLHNLMRVRYPTLHLNLVDNEDQNHQVVRGAWKDDRPWAGLQHAGGHSDQGSEESEGLPEGLRELPSRICSVAAEHDMSRQVSQQPRHQTALFRAKTKQS